MINISNIADSLERGSISDEMERLSKLIQTIYFSPFDKLGQIRDIFDATSKEDFLKLFEVINEEETFSLEYDDDDLKILGDKVSCGLFINSYWNANSNYYHWEKLKNNKKTFI